MTKQSKRLMICLSLAFVGVMLLVDHALVSRAEQVVIATCQTRVSYDKSGSMICLDLPHKAVKVAQQ